LVLRFGIYLMVFYYLNPNMLLISYDVLA
jgi:hypothetical protein